jgi:hypothetical protein
MKFLKEIFLIFPDFRLRAILSWMIELAIEELDLEVDG